jgi:hypothetical protein
MKKFLVNIWAYDHHAKFEVDSEDNPQSLENAILDKLGEKSIKWEHLGASYSSELNRITYEEVINGDASTSIRSIQTEEVTGSTMGAGAS